MLSSYRFHLIAVAVAALIAATAAPRADAVPLPAAPADVDTTAGRSELYREGQRALAENRYADAATLFARLAAEGTGEADAALYWKAWAEARAARKAAALATIRELLASHPESAWADDAEALEIELRGAPRAPRPPRAPEPPRTPRPEAATAPPAPRGPVPPVAPAPPREAREARSSRQGRSALSEDEELKLYALDALMQVEPDKAIPVLERFLAGDQPLRLKQRALFVLSQSESPRAREILLRTVREGTPEELRIEAVRTLGIAGEAEDVAALATLFGSSSPRSVRAAVLEAFMIADAAAPLATAARTDPDPEIRARAIDMLGAMEAREELRALYESEREPALRRRLLQAFGVAEDVEGLTRAARSETDLEVRLAVIEALAITDSDAAVRPLLDLYRGSSEPRIRRKVAEALMVQEQAAALITLFREEKDPELKRAIVQFLGMVESDEAEQVLLEVLEGKP